MKKKYSFLFGVLTTTLCLTSFHSQAQEESSHNEERPFVMGAIGDSITTAMNATFWGNRPKYSWSTGDKNENAVISHYQKLKESLNRPVKKVIVARSGARTSDLKKQITRLLVKKIDYVTVLIGSNDLCAWDSYYQNDIKRFKQNLEDGIKRLVNHNSQIKILLVAIPNLINLREIGLKHNCQWRWDLFNICPGLLRSDSSPQDRELFSTKLKESNLILQEIANQYPHNIKFNHALSEFKFPWDAVSKLDCFHPSTKGQDLISKLTWQQGWFESTLYSSYDE